jgi:hypothetical protein
MIDQNADPARTKFFILGLVRLGGVVLAFLGISIMAKHWVEPADIIGGALIVLGAAGVLVVPRVLARQWRSPRP